VQALTQSPSRQKEMPLEKTLIWHTERAGTHRLFTWHPIAGVPKVLRVSAGSRNGDVDHYG
jgi:hypothetical protein